MGKNRCLSFKLLPLISLLRSCVVHKNERRFVLQFCNTITFATPNGIDDTNLNHNVKERLWSFQASSLTPKTHASNRGQSGTASIKKKYIFLYTRIQERCRVFTVQLIVSLPSALASSLRIWWMNASLFSPFPAPVLCLGRPLLLKTFASGQQRFPAMLPTAHATAGKFFCLSGSQV